MKSNSYLRLKFGFKWLFIGFIIVSECYNTAYSQAEVEPWGNFTGIRLEGQLMSFETSLDVISNDWLHTWATAQERQRPKFARQQNTQLITTQIDSFHFTESITDTEKGTVKVNVQFTAAKETDSVGLYFNLRLPWADYHGGVIKLINREQDVVTDYDAASADTGLLLNTADVKFSGSYRQLELRFANAVQLNIKKKNDNGFAYLSIYIPLQKGHINDGQTGQASFTVKVTGRIDKSLVTMHLDTSQPGSQFAGLGGNFRLQNFKTDPQVIDYCLKNLRVAWGRVEMPWSLWQPEKNSNPVDSANAGRLNPRVANAMQMAQRLYKMGIPVILTAWFPPQWAVDSPLVFGPRPNGVWGNALNDDSTEAIYKSITDYIVYLKDHYGVEVRMFSFNESDLGINIRQTGEEHAKLIKGLGAYFAARGLATKMLLGDNSDATTYQFISAAVRDTATYPYIGAISFHSWRGWDSNTLQKWADAAKQMNLPLLVGEGSTDAAAWAYPAIFDEQVYALKEINLYTRLMAICQPVSILQWQLTADYSPLAGGGIFGNNEPLRPTRRFYNLKQLASIPANLYAMPITTQSTDITCAAQGDNTKGLYAVHIVNNGAKREIVITGLPASVQQLNIYTTSATFKMQEGIPLKVVKGKVKFIAEAACYITLVNG